MTVPIDTFTLAKGFQAVAVACGLKGSGALDLALVAAEQGCSAAGVFTTNRVKAAPVLYDQDLLTSNPTGIRAVLANAGCANACTGAQGMLDARRSAALIAEQIGCRPDQVLLLSTGVIGRPLDMDKFARGIAALSSQSALRGAAHVASAIMTTDLVPKVAGQNLTIAGKEVFIRGFAKGSGMIHPNMATMLAVITTDAIIAPTLLHQLLQRAIEQSFNRISVDGDTSTNDTVLLLASGAAGVEVDTNQLPAFAEPLNQTCISLAKQIARDGEGATRLVAVRVTGAIDVQQAHQVANSIARSPLVKTAIHGGDPNWGRVLCAAGYSGVPLDPDRLTLLFGPEDQRLTVVEAGLPAIYDERAASALLQCDPVDIQLDLGLGRAETTVWTCDFSKQYVEINAHYTT